MPELSEKKSLELAQFIEMLKPPLHLIDEHIGTDYIEELAVEFLGKASRQESMQVLNPSYPQVKNDLARMNAQALLSLKNFIESLKECDKLKNKIGEENCRQEKINSLFL